MSELDVVKLPLELEKFSFVILRFAGEFEESNVKFEGSKRLVIDGICLSADPFLLFNASDFSSNSFSELAESFGFLSNNKVSCFTSPLPTGVEAMSAGLSWTTCLISDSIVLDSGLSDDKPNFAIPDWSFAKPPPNIKSSEGWRTWELVLVDPGNLSSNVARVVKIPPIKFKHIISLG